jgi:membrane protease YdiL (CAAX protease family)
VSQPAIPAQGPGGWPAPGPAPALRYHELQAAGRRGWWRPVAGTLSLVLLMLVVVPLLIQLPFAIWFAATGQPVISGMERLLDLSDPTPLGLAYLNLVLACAIPVTWLLTRVLHGLRPRWLASVAGGIRWRWFLVCFGLSVVSLLATLVVSSLVPASAGDSQVSTQVNDFTETTRDFLLVVLLLTPLQAAGEEYAFRGYLTQAFGGLFRQPWVAVAGPALLFALAHGAQDAPVFFDRFAFGVVAGVLVIATGGLEAGIAMHVLNNWLAFGLALAFGDMGSALNPTGGSWWSLPVTLTQSLVYLGLTLFVARRMGLATATGPAVLAAPSRRV